MIKSGKNVINTKKRTAFTTVYQTDKRLFVSNILYYILKQVFGYLAEKYLSEFSD